MKPAEVTMEWTGNVSCELVTLGVYQVWAGQGSAVNKSVWKPHTEQERPPGRSSWRQVSLSACLHLPLHTLLSLSASSHLFVGFKHLTSKQNKTSLFHFCTFSETMFSRECLLKRANRAARREDIKTRLPSWNWPFWIEFHSRRTQTLENAFMHPDRAAKWHRGTEEMDFSHLITLTTDCGRW